MQEDGEMMCKRIHSFVRSRQLKSTQLARIQTKNKISGSKQMTLDTYLSS